MKPPCFEYVAPRQLTEALHAMRQYGDDAKPLAGGQSLGPLLNLRLASPGVLVDLGRVSALAEDPIVDTAGVYVPAMVTQRRVETNPWIARTCPLLPEAIGNVAHRTIRNRGTVCGSITHADPAAELTAVAVATGATCHVSGPNGDRKIDARDFLQGFFTTDLESDELLVGVRFPALGPLTGSAWEEFAPRKGDYALVGVGAVVQLDPRGAVAKMSLAYSGIADRPYRADEIDRLLIGRQLDADGRRATAELASTLCSPGDDAAGPAKYRRQLVRVLTERALLTAKQRAEEVR